MIRVRTGIIHFMSGLLRIESERNLTHISRAMGVNEQALQHFMSESPWSGEAVIEQVQVAVAALWGSVWFSANFRAAIS